MNKIKLSGLNRFYGSIRKIREHVFEHVAPQQLLSANKERVVYFTLQQFNFRKPIGWNDTVAIEKACTFILTKTSFYIKGKMDEELHRNGEAYDPINHYFKEILGFEKLPRNVFDDLDALVRADLREILNLIERYETTEAVIKEFLETGEKRSEHEGKIRLDFYQRCLNERDKIVKYLANGIEQRAVFKATFDNRLDGALSWFEAFRDRPYRWGQHNSKKYFDYKLIDPCKHRLGDVLVRDIPPLEKLYAEGMYNKFYRRLKKLIPPEHIFQQIFTYYIPHNPKVEERAPVFYELHTLMRSGKWYGFTALALTQVEGIFSDMLAVITPNKSHSSLSTKVFAVRPFYEYHESSFDYFEYLLPRIRNRFLHSGSIKGHDFKRLAYDLLYDLHYILKVFLQLKDNQIKLTNMLNGYMQEQLSDLEAYVELFSMLKDLRAREKSNPRNAELTALLHNWDNFEKDDLKESGNLEYFADQIIKELHVNTSKFFRTLHENSKYGKFEVDLVNMSAKDLKDKLEMVRQTFAMSWHFNEEFEKIFKTHIFLREYKTYLPNFPKDAAEALKRLEKQEKDNQDIAKIQLLRSIFESVPA